jgi:MFS family permease
VPTTIRERGNLRATLASHGFRRLLGVRLISQLVDGLFQAGLAGSLLFNPERAASARTVAAGFAALLLPYSLVGPYVGVFLDRWSRRTVIFTANLTRAMLVVPAALLTWYGHQSAVYVILALLIIGMNRFFLSGLSAAQPHVVGQRRLVTANALATTLGTLTYSLGLGLAVLLLSTMLRKDFHGYATTAGVAALGYASSALLARGSFKLKELGPDDGARTPRAVLRAIVAVARSMVAGLYHLRERPTAMYAMGVQSAHRVMYGTLTIATLLLYRHYFSVGVDFSKSLSGLAEVAIAGGFGSLTAAFLTPPISRRIGGWRWIAILLIAAGMLIFVLGLPFRPGLLVAATFCINVASQGTKIVVDTTLQRDCDDEYRGRVFSVNDTTFNLAFVVGLFAGAFTLPANGKSVVAIVLVSTGYVLLGAGYGLIAGRLAHRVALQQADAHAQ